MRCRALILFACLTVCDAVEAQPVPAEPVQNERLKALHEIYASEYSQRKTIDRAAFARTLLDQGRATTDDLPARYVFLREAADLAAKAGDVATGQAALTELAASFLIDADEEALRFYAAIPQASITTLEQARQMIEAMLGISDRAVAVENYQLAQRAVQQADGLGRRLKDPALSARTRQAVDTVKDLSSQYEALGPVTDVLGQMTPDGHARYGRFLAVAKRAWDLALPHLVQGDDGPLKALAEADLAATTAEGRLAAADGWYEYAQSQKGPGKLEFLARAGQLYAAAIPSLTGLNLARIEKRLAELNKLLGNRSTLARWPVGAVLIITCEGTSVTPAGVADQSPNQLRATLTGAVVERGPWGMAMRFDGVDDVATIPNAAPLQIAGSMTLAMWLRPDQLGGRRNPWHKSYGAEGTWTIEDTPGVTFFCGTAGLDDDPYGSCYMPSPLAVGTWAHLVSVRNAETKQIIWYKDGTEVFREGTGYAPASISDAAVRIGNGYAGPYAGLIDEIGLWPRALDAKEVTALYQATAAGRR